MYENVIRNNTDKKVIMTDKSTSVRNVPWVRGVEAGRKKDLGISRKRHNILLKNSS